MCFQCRLPLRVQKRRTCDRCRLASNKSRELLALGTFRTLLTLVILCARVTQMNLVMRDLPDEFVIAVKKAAADSRLSVKAWVMETAQARIQGVVNGFGKAGAVIATAGVPEVRGGVRDERRVDGLPAVRGSRPDTLDASRSLGRDSQRHSEDSSAAGAWLGPPHAKSCRCARCIEERQ